MRMRVTNWELRACQGASQVPAALTSAKHKNAKGGRDWELWIDVGEKTLCFILGRWAKPGRQRKSMKEEVVTQRQPSHSYNRRTHKETKERDGREMGERWEREREVERERGRERGKGGGGTDSDFGAKLRS